MAFGRHRLHPRPTQSGTGSSPPPRNSPSQRPQPSKTVQAAGPLHGTALSAAIAATGEAVMVSEADTRMGPTGGFSPRNDRPLSWLSLSVTNHFRCRLSELFGIEELICGDVEDLLYHAVWVPARSAEDHWFAICDLRGQQAVVACALDVGSVTLLTIYQHSDAWERRMATIKGWRLGMILSSLRCGSGSPLRPQGRNPAR